MSSLKRFASWFALITIIITGLFGIEFYLTVFTFLISFVIGILTILYLTYDHKKIFSVDLECLDDPLQQTNFSIQVPKVLELFQKQTTLPKYDSRITGSETVDSFLNEIITIIINDYVTPWYEVLTDDEEFTNHSIKRLVLAAGANIANRVKCVDWIHLLSTRFPEELTTHLKLFKQSRVRLKHIDLLSAKEMANGNARSSPKRQDEKKMHRRNKSETDLTWAPDTQTFGKSKFYGSSENISGRTLKDIFFELECSIENRKMCRDLFCTDAEKEYELLCEISEAVLYLVAPEEAWKCHALKLILIELLSGVVLKPMIQLLSDPDTINRTIIRSCCRESTLPSDLFLVVIRCCTDAEELDATLELVQKDIQKLHSRDSAGEWELQDKQKLSSLQYLVRIIQARRATLGPQEGLSASASTDKVSEEVARSLKFLRATTAWRSNAQYLLEIELNEADAPSTSKAVLDNLRSSALELCDLYLAPNRPPVLGIPPHCYADLVRDITTEGEHFAANPVACFDPVQKCVETKEAVQYFCSFIYCMDRWPTISTKKPIPTKTQSNTLSSTISIFPKTIILLDAPSTSKAVLDNLRSSALELCDLYLAPNRPPMLGIPPHCYADLVRDITTEGEHFAANPVAFFDPVQKCVETKEAVQYFCSFIYCMDRWPTISTKKPIPTKTQSNTLSSTIPTLSKTIILLDAPSTSKAVLDNLRSSALELCDLYLAPNRPPVLGIPPHCYADLVRDITTEGEHFAANPVACFDPVQKCVCIALEDDPSWQADYMMDSDDNSERNSDPKKEEKPESKKYSGDLLAVPGTRHNRSRSDIVGNLAQRMINESAGPSNLTSAATSNLSLSHSEISRNAKKMLSPLSASIIETALVQDKGKTFGIYAIAVTRLADNKVWHIYRRYSDFYDLHSTIKDKWPELGNLPFPGKKTFQNTSRTVLESRKRMLNNYLQTLANLARDAKYMTLLSPPYLGGFLSPENQAEKHSNSIDALLVNSLRAGMRTLKNMPDQFANTVDGVMDGISKVFQGKSDENFDGFRGNSSEGQDDGDESFALKLFEEVLGIRGLWLRRRLLAPIRTLIADRVNKKVLEFVSSLTSPRNVVQYLKTFKQWLTSRNNSKYSNRDAATKARTRVAAKVALLSACSDDLRHIVGTDTARRSLLTVFDLFQTQEINSRLILVLLETILTNLFPDNKMQELFKKIYSNSPRVPVVKKSVNI